MYPEYLVTPMRQELVDAGFEELKSAEAVESVIPAEGTVFVVVNSILKLKMELLKVLRPLVDAMEI